MAKVYSALSLLFFCAGLDAQAPKVQPAAPASAVATPTTPDALLTQEELIQVKKVPYLATLNRDPFSAPTDLEQSNKGDLVDDIGVKGWLKSGGVAFAVVTDSRGNVRKLPVGYKFRDGEIVSIDDKSVTFHQWDVSSTNRSTYKTIVRTFKREEGKR